jgi:uncharacterized membrane protein YdjX (TVP38/TMEM64 family)
MKRITPGRVLAVIVAIAAIAAIVLAGRRLGGEVTAILDRISALGPAAPAAFIAIYVVACVMFVPGSILTIGAGVLFGVVRGSIYVSIGATLGATAAFVLGRYLMRDWVARRIERNARFRAIDDAVGREGWKIVALTRLSPVFPFNLLNYAFGLTNVSLLDYVAASWAGMIPGTVLYVYIGSLSGDLARAASRGAQTRPAGAWVLNVVGFVATLAVAIYATRIGARALREKT